MIVSIGFRFEGLGGVDCLVIKIRFLIVYENEVEMLEIFWFNGEKGYLKVKRDRNVLFLICLVVF